MTDLPEESSVQKRNSLRDRFALRRLDVFLILLIALLLGAWIYERGNLPYEGILRRPLRVGIVPWPGYAGGLVANNGLRASKDSYFWTKHQLLVEFVPIKGEDELLREFANGNLDIIWSTVDSLAQQAPTLRKENVRPRAFMQVDWSRGGDALIVTADIGRIEDLKGKRVAVSTFASQWLFENSLKNSTLSPADRNVIRQMRVKATGSENAREIFATNNAEAAVLWEPEVTKALSLRAGSKPLVDTSSATNLIADIMVAKEEFIQRRSDVIAAFIDGWLYGTTQALGDPMLAVKVLQDEPEFAALGDEKTRELIGKTRWATLGDNAEMFGLSGEDVVFDRLFSQASEIWSKDYNKDTISAEQARDIGIINEIYRGSLSSAAKQGCDPKTQNPQTVELDVPFPANKADLAEEAKNILANQDALFLLQTHTGARFCVQATPVAGDDLTHALEISIARESAVIDYLVKYYHRTWNQFVSANSASSGTSSNGTAAQYIRLKLSSPGNRP
jgi:NitT/TauT family transport system substrate-binding protein